MDLEALAPKRPERPIYRFTIPQNVLSEVKEVGLVELTADEELACAQRARGQAARLMYELARAALVEVNKQRVSANDGSADKAFNAMDPKVRNMVLAAYTDLHAPKEEAMSDFLASRSVSVG